MRLLALLLLLPLSLAQIPSLFSNEYSYDTRYESEEIVEGERTCLPLDETSLCPHEGVGIRVLDDFYFVRGPSRPTVGSVAGSIYPLSTPQEGSGLNPRRFSGGLFPEVILPGEGYFRAWYGWWTDVNENGIIEGTFGPSTGDPLGEWTPVPNEKLYSFIDPGPHPTISDRRTPPDDIWDVTYRLRGITYDTTTEGREQNSAYHFVLFTDGSLFRSMEVVTLARAILVPSSQRPYTETFDSRVDIDEYVAWAPAPLSSIYSSTVGALLDPLGSPSLDWCPTQSCRAWPRPPTSLPFLGSTLESVGVGEVADGVVGAPFALYAPEYLPGSNSSNEEYASYLVSYRPFGDLLPMMGLERITWAIARSWVVGPLVQLTPLSYAPEDSLSPLLRNSEGEGSLPWGTSLGGEIWVGAWMDLSGDGRVGRMDDPSDPYRGGSRPLPDNYRESSGEFVGAQALFDPTTGDPIPAIPVKIFPDSGNYLDLGYDQAILSQATSRPFSITTWAWPSGPKGHYVFSEGWAFDLLLGTTITGLVICAGPVDVQVEGVPPGSSTFSFTFFDCDHVGRFDPT